MLKWLSQSARIILIGDAAHAMSPSGSQGGSTSFEDAETLALVIANTRESLLFDMLQRWEAHRMERIRQIMTFNMITTRFRQATRNWLLQVCRDWLVWAIFKFNGPRPYAWIFEYDSRYNVKLKLS